MSRSASGRETWLPTGIVACALLVVAPLLAVAGDDPREWLQRMTRALATRNYDGTFFHLSNGQVEAMRIVHRVRDGHVTERLQSLEGSGREYVRDNDRLTCYLPDKHKILVATRQSRGPFLSSLPHFGSGADRFYRIESLPQGRVLGRAVRVIAVSPKDQYRFGYRLWLDQKTAMPLKTQLCDSRGQVIEQILFAKLDMPQTIPDRDLKPTVSTADMRWVIQSPSQRASPAIAAFRASELPPGFEFGGSRRANAWRCRRAGGALGVLRRIGDGLRFRGGRSATGQGAGWGRRCVVLRTDAWAGARWLGFRLLDGRAGTPGHRGRRSTRRNRRVHRAFGQGALRRRNAAPLNMRRAAAIAARR